MAKDLAGLPVTEVRSLSLDEYAAVRSDLRNTRVLRGIVGVLSPFLLLVWLTFLAILRGQLNGYLICLFGGVLVLAGAGLAAWWSTKRIQALRQDLESGVVAVLNGRMDNQPWSDLANRLFGIRVLSNRDPHVEHEIQLYMGSRRLLLVDGVLVRLWITLSTNEPQGAPEQAPTRATRALSQPERLELEKSCLAPSIVVAACWVAAGISYLAAVGVLLRIWPFLLHPAFISLLAASLVTALLGAFGAPTVADMRRDARTTLVYRHGLHAGADPEQVGTNLPLHEVVVESLPYSGRTWTIDGHEARWREQRDRTSPVRAG
ncbi:MAG TPA: hypothetical protein VMI31_08715 [Fimbriimonadaceae bacterium]|nr:hypothetical protein [Fimbriimonadaceae bacterium]